jgi:hypothetical protein
MYFSRAGSQESGCEIFYLGERRPLLQWEVLLIDLAKARCEGTFVEVLFHRNLKGGFASRMTNRVRRLAERHLDSHPDSNLILLGYDFDTVARDYRTYWVAPTPAEAMHLLMLGGE